MLTTAAGAPARLALLCAAAEAIGPVAAPDAAGAAYTGPAPPAWVLAEYAVAGWLVGEDVVLGIDTGRTFWGWLLTTKTEAVAVLRGTEDASEWAADAEGWPVESPGLPGMVEQGFASIYETLELMPSSGAVQAGRAVQAGVSWAPCGATGSAPTTIASVVGHRRVTVAGHSLGACLAEYMTYELVGLLPGRVLGRYFESPRPGDQAFAAAFQRRVTDYRVWRYAPDLVPDLPPWNTPLADVTLLPSNPAICDTPLCNHHAKNIAWLIDPAATEIVPACRAARGA